MQIRDNLSGNSPTPQVTQFCYKLPHLVQMTILPDNTESHKMSVVDSVNIMDNQDATLQYADSLDAVFVRLFMRLDSVVEAIIGIGGGFAQRYKKLPKSNDWEIILSEIYRIFTVFRHAAIHHPGLICLPNNHVKVSFTHNNSLSEAELDTCGFELAATILDIFYKWPQRHLYIEALLRAYYQELLGRIVCFSDIHSGTLNHVSGALILKRSRRVLITNPDYNVSCGDLYIAKHESKHPEAKIDCEGYDYCIDYDSQQFHIPEELLEPSYTLPIAEVTQWTPVLFSCDQGKSNVQ